MAAALNQSHPSPADGSNQPAPPRRAARMWAFRLAAMLGIPALLLVILELGLRLAGYGYETAFFRPRRIGGKACFIENRQFGWRFFGPRLARTPLPLAIRDPKPPGSCRIFVFGESAAYGDPQPAFGVSRHLEVLLGARFPQTRFDVVNVAMTGINSHVVREIARDCARRQGDIWVVYMGNNEVVGPYGAGTVFGWQAPSLIAIRAGMALKSTRFGQLLETLGRKLKPDASPLEEWGGMTMFLEHKVSSHDPRLARVYAHFERNLRQIIQTGIGSGARVVVSTVAVNLRDCAPFASEHRPKLDSPSLETWKRLFQSGCDAQDAGRPADAIAAFHEAEKLDDTFAELHFRWAQAALATGNTNEARLHFRRARDEDVLRFRCDSRLNERTRQAASGREPEGVFFADAEKAFDSGDASSVPGASLFYEHVHLRFEGNYLLARCLADEVVKALPESARSRTSATNWLNAVECAQRLCWGPCSIREGAAQMLARMADPPFTYQSTHDLEMRRLADEVNGAAPGLQPEELRQTAAFHRVFRDLRPDDPWLLENLGQIELRLGNTTNAFDAWQRLVEIRPQHAPARAQLGRCLVLLQRPSEAVATFEELLAEDPDSIPAREGLAYIHAQRGDDQAAAAQHKAILKRHLTYSPSHLALGLLLKKSGTVEEAQRHYRAAVAHPLNTAPARRAIGQICFEEGWLPEAVTNLARSLELDPSDATTHLRLGQVLALQRRHPEAAAAYAEALRWNPGLAEAHFRLAFELGRQGRDAEALEHFAAAARIDPAMWQARLNLGIAAYRQGRMDEARREFQAVLNREPTNATARQYLRRMDAGAGSAGP